MYCNGKQVRENGVISLWNGNFLKDEKMRIIQIIKLER